MSESSAKAEMDRVCEPLWSAVRNAYVRLLPPDRRVRVEEQVPGWEGLSDGQQQDFADASLPPLMVMVDAMETVTEEEYYLWRSKAQSTEPGRNDR